MVTRKSKNVIEPKIILCGLLIVFTIAGIVVSLIGALDNSAGNIVMIVAGTLMVAVSSFALTLVAKMLG